tara:strand:+ start:6126 stop:6323 length:198 start_codon:yes stop_codon:yes gene_type:complete
MWENYARLMDRLYELNLWIRYGVPPDYFEQTGCCEYLSPEKKLHELKRERAEIKWQMFGMEMEDR